MEPKISIIMGIYNPKTKEMIDKCLNSIINQTFVDWECILCDDGTSNNMFDYIIEKYSFDKRFVFIKNERNLGLRVALNNAIKHSKAKYLVRQDIDDYSDINRLSILYKIAIDNPEWDVIGTSMMKFADDKIWGKYTPRVFDIKKKDFLKGNVVAHATTIIKKSSIEKVSGYRVAWETIRCEDIDLFMRMFAKGCVIKNIDVPLYFVREDKDAYSRKKYANRIKEAVVKYKGFKMLNMPLWGYIYVFRPLIVGLVPNKLMFFLKKVLHK